MHYKDTAFDTVFIVDDDPIINLIHQKIIANIGIAHEIRSFTDPQKALDDLCFNVSNSVPTLVLLDLNMPGMSGFDFLKLLESGDFPLNIDVIVVTSSVCERDRLLAKEHPRFLRDFLIKPLKVENLKKIIEYSYPPLN